MIKITIKMVAIMSLKMMAIAKMIAIMMSRE